MSEPLFSYTSAVAPDHPLIATGHVATRMAWEDGPNGKRRPGSTPETDDQGRHGHVVDVLMPLGRDGAPQVFGVTVWIEGFEVPQPTAFAPIEFDNLRVTVRAHRSGKGVDVSFTADGIATSGRAGRRAADVEAA